MTQTAALSDIVACLSRSLDLVSRQVSRHHEQVCVIAAALAEELALPEARRADLLWAAALHDAGAFSLRERVDLLDFDCADGQGHAETGYRLMRDFAPLRAAADIVRHHHLPWRGGAGSRAQGRPVPEEAHLLHLADRIAISLDASTEVLGQSQTVAARIQERSGELFMPVQAEAFARLARKESFWLDSVGARRVAGLPCRARSPRLPLDRQTLRGLARLLCRIIDFRSPFTATHSSGVAASARCLAAMAGFRAEDCELMHLAGLIHDLGKLAVPTEILQKPGALTREEHNVIRAHSYHTYRTLEAVAGLGTVAQWGAFHHERPDGTGYPFRLRGEELSLGARVMAVADVFTALAEDRPYRAGCSRQAAMAILGQMAAAAHLDPPLVSLLGDRYAEIDAERAAAQAAASEEYRLVRQGDAGP